MNTDAVRIPYPFDVAVLWKLSRHHSVEGRKTWMYVLAADAWDAYESLIAALEHDGYVRQGVEAIEYGKSATQQLTRDHATVTVHLTRTDAPESPVDA